MGKVAKDGPLAQVLVERSLRKQRQLAVELEQTKTLPHLRPRLDERVCKARSVSPHVERAP